MFDTQLHRIMTRHVRDVNSLMLDVLEFYSIRQTPEPIRGIQRLLGSLRLLLESDRYRGKPFPEHLTFRLVTTTRHMGRVMSPLLADEPPRTPAAQVRYGEWEALRRRFEEVMRYVRKPEVEPRRGQTFVHRWPPNRKLKPMH